MVGSSHEKVAFASPEEYAAIMHGRIRKPGMTDEQYKNELPPGAKDADGKEVPANKEFYVTDFPAKIIRADAKGGNRAFLEDFIARGQERFNINCVACHGGTGFGDGMVQRRANAIPSERDDAAKGISGADYVSLWTVPAQLTAEKFNDVPGKGQSVGKLFNTITNGQTGMPPYDKQLSVQDRWAIVMYLRALQLSQGGAAATPPAQSATDK
jgi:mono/diheme cytochrome c family protein